MHKKFYREDDKSVSGRPSASSGPGLFTVSEPVELAARPSASSGPGLFTVSEPVELAGDF